jgi:hypothetical protein
MNLTVGGASKFSVNKVGSVTASGQLQMTGAVIAGTAVYVGGTSANAGILQSGGAGGIVGIFNSVGSDFKRLQFGGTTASFVALKPVSSTLTLAVRTADDSADANFSAATGTFSGSLYVGTTTAGGNISVAATYGAEQAPALTAGNWTVGTGWESPIVGPGLIKNADGTGTATPSAATTIVAGTTYKVVFTVTGWSGDTFGVTVGGDTIYTSLNANGTYTNYVTAATTGKIIFAPRNTSRFTISSVSIIPFTAGTGDITADGHVTGRSGMYVGDGATTAGPGYSFTAEPTLGWTRTAVGTLTATGATTIQFQSAGSTSFTFQRNGSDSWLSGQSGGPVSFSQISGQGSGAFIEWRSALNATQPNGTNIYNTYTSATNYERAQLGFVSNDFVIGTQKGSAGGTLRDIVFQTSSTNRMRIASSGLIGIGTDAPSSTLHILMNGSSTLEIGGNSTSTGSACIKMHAASGTVGTAIYIYYDSNAVQYATTTKPTFCE